MRIFLAGGISGNLRPMWGGCVKLIKQGSCYEKAKEEALKIFMAGVSPWRTEKLYDDTIMRSRPSILESFFYVDADTERLLPDFGDFLLDSGAFTFMENAKVRVDWEEYIERYSAFIVKNKIQKFFELDIDSVVGYDKVREYRARLEKLTNKQPIPVWHIKRGKDEFLRHCEEYPYVALGGIVSGEWSGTAQGKMPWFINEAHQRGVKIHGLGYTKLDKLKEYHFDSVDSTSWTTGNRFGFVYKFNGRTMVKVNVPAGKRIADSRKVALINFTEWVKFQQWAETHL